MTLRETKKLAHGLYRIYWKTSDVSLAAVGSTHSGRRWFAPANWTSVDAMHPLVARTDWQHVNHVALIEAA